MEFILLAKVAMVFNVVEKLCYGAFGVYMAKVGVRYVKDYKESMEEEKFVGGN